MKKNILLMGLLALCLGFVSCSSDSDDTSEEVRKEVDGFKATYATILAQPTDEPCNLATVEKALEAYAKLSDEAQKGLRNEKNTLDKQKTTTEAWGTYVKKVAGNVKKAAGDLWYEWDNQDYGAKFKKHTGYNNAHGCVDQMLQGCETLRSSLSKNTQMATTESVYAGRSLEDYKANVKSIAYVLAGKIVADYNLPAEEKSTKEEIAKCVDDNSILMAALNSSNEILVSSAVTAWNGIAQSLKAIDKFDELGTNKDEWAKQFSLLQAGLEYILGNQKTFFSEEDCEAIAKQFVDAVAMVSIRQLDKACSDLSVAASDLQVSTTSSAFQETAKAWQEAHKLWELTAAFQFGPAESLKTASYVDCTVKESSIKSLISSQNWSALDSNESMRGFHALEWLLYKEGSVRTIK